MTKTADQQTQAQTPKPTRQQRSKALQQHRATVEAHFSRHYGELYTLVYELHPSLLCQDAENILTQLAAKLPKHRGVLTETVLQRWMVRFVTTQANRLAAAVEIMDRNRGVITRTIRSTMPYDLFDYSLEVDDLSQEIFIRILDNPFRFQPKPGDTAKESTRIHAVANKHLVDYYTKKMRNRWEIIQQQLACGEKPYGPYVATLSPYEWAVMKQDDIDAEAIPHRKAA